MRSPDEILDAFDAGSRDRIVLVPRQIDMRGVLWEVIEDILDSLGRYASWKFDDASPPAVVKECKAMLTDYVTNAYGDD